MSSFEDLLKKYDYVLPPSLIAIAPASPRDSAKLLVYDRESRKTYFDRFSNLGKYLPKNAVLVLNDTKVIPARLALAKETGGRVKILYLGTKGNLIEALAEKKLELGMTLSLTPKIIFRVVKKEENHYFLKPSFAISKIHGVLERYGTTPIPPYIKNSLLSEKNLRKEYQTVFARTKGSVAAPTASLHFTKRLLANLKKQGVSVAHTTLHVGLGTFGPLIESQVKTSRLHSEYFSIDLKTAAFLNKAKKEKRPIVAVGTTVVRTLESASDKQGRIKKYKGETDLFIREGYAFKFVDHMITNFHVPKSSLLMLASAFTGRKNILGLYKTAIRKQFRFFSFGDGMLIK